MNEVPESADIGSDKKDNGPSLDFRWMRSVMDMYELSVALDQTDRSEDEKAEILRNAGNSIG